ncbi:MAG: hypothetical protein DIZ78_01760 [endosymbiont of Escarpia spicata]|uniref:Uncharacterized protein n=1 Tax=endosymbiont of Escarpia spicata TaxID=2200908 RepID=A0A370DSK7_9GAMM|nr:MAG: hypothetical protein DIZ78_01760 [endosymbiont of Escarpia spicata]
MLLIAQIEDILEEVAEEIQDEDEDDAGEPETQLIRRQEDGTLLVNTWVDLSDLAEGWRLLPHTRQAQLKAGPVCQAISLLVGATGSAR